jgi:hypothetical protein
MQKYGLLRRGVPLRKRFAFVAGNDGDRTRDFDVLDATVVPSGVVQWMELQEQGWNDVRP